MKVLMINKFYYIKGGSETYYFALKTLLEEHGHEVVDFSMKDSKNYKSPYEKYFVEHVEYDGKTNITDKMRMALRIIYSFEAKRKLEQLIIETKPDIAHLHIFQHQMSPSVLSVLHKHKIPIVYTAHDLKMLCLNYKMLNHTGVCEQCKNHKYYNCVKNKCIKESTTKSIICMLEGYLHQMLHSYDKINCIITPSKFYHDKFIEFGINPERVCYIPNFLEERTSNTTIEERVEDYFLFLGRLSEEKGIQTLLDAVEDTKHRLKIAGTGPMAEELKRYISQHALTNVELLGFQQGEKLQQLIQKAKAVILPSEWYENSPYSGIEAISHGKIIIGSNMGGIPELIQHGDSGYIFQAMNSQSLLSDMDTVAALEENTYNQMQRNARQLFEERFTAATHYKQLMAVYEKVVK